MLAWLVEQAPWLGIVIMIAAAVALATTLRRIIASPDRLRTALSIGLTFACSHATIVVLSALFANDDSAGVGTDAEPVDTLASTTTPNPATAAQPAATEAPTSTEPADAPPETTPAAILVPCAGGAGGKRRSSRSP